MVHEDERSIRGRRTRREVPNPAESQRPFQPLSDQELEVLYDLHSRSKISRGLTDDETQALQILDKIRVRELNELTPPDFQIIILGRFSKDLNFQRSAEQETERARTFYREAVSLSNDERKERFRRREELYAVIYGWSLDIVRDRIDPERNAQTAEFILQERRKLRPLTPEEDREHTELVRKLESRGISARENRRLSSLRDLGHGEGDLLMGDNLDSFASASESVAMEALRFFEEWESLTPQDQRARYDRIVELNDRAIKITNIKDASKKRKEDSERARKVVEIISRRNPQQLVFEGSLFQEGVLAFDTPAVYFETHPPMRGKEMEMVMWLEDFKGRVPARWDRWGNIIDDFEKAKEAGVQLNSVLTDAGVTHWHHAVVATVAKTQRLTPLQIAMALEAGDAKWFREDILKGQREMGTPVADINEAAYQFLSRGNYSLREIPFRGDVRTVE